MTKFSHNGAIINKFLGVALMDTSVLNWLDRTAEQYSEKTVFNDCSRSVSFAEFNRITKSVGTYLASFVTPNSPVVVMSGRHIMTPACFLGIVRAGCFYAPMDATMPKARLNQIIGVIKADYMIVDKEHLEIAKGLDFDGKIIIFEDVRWFFDLFSQDVFFHLIIFHYCDVFINLPLIMILFIYLTTLIKFIHYFIRIHCYTFYF